MLTPEERDDLLERLAHAIDRIGYEPFVSAHLLFPQRAHLPDAWTPDRVGVEATARRLLAYAMVDCDVHVAAYPSRADARAEDGASPLPIWFEGFIEDTCVLGLHEAALRDDAEQARTICRAVADAVRARHKMRDWGETIDADVAGVLLGFGVLMARRAFPSELRETAYRTRGRASVASSSSMTWLLAVQAVVREDQRSREKIAATLDAEDAEEFRAACAELDATALRKRLAIPPREQWPTYPPLASYVPPPRKRRPRTTARRDWKPWVAIGVASAVLVAFGVATGSPRAGCAPAAVPR